MATPSSRATYRQRRPNPWTTPDTVGSTQYAGEASGMGMTRRHEQKWTTPTSLDLPESTSRRRCVVTRLSQVLWVSATLFILSNTIGVYRAVKTPLDYERNTGGSFLAMDPESSYRGSSLRVVTSNGIMSPALDLINTSSGHVSSVERMADTNKVVTGRSPTDMISVGNFPGELQTGIKDGRSTVVVSLPPVGGAYAGPTTMFQANVPVMKAAPVIQSVGRDNVSVTTRTRTILADESVGLASMTAGGFGDEVGGAMDGLQGRTNLNSVVGRGVSPTPGLDVRGAVTDGTAWGSDRFQSLERQVTLLEGKLSSLPGTNEDDEGQLIEVDELQRKKNNDKERNSIASLDCTQFDGPYSESATSDVVYWKKIPRDDPFRSPFHGEIMSAGRAGFEIKRQYLTFEVNLQAGWNHNRLIFETMLVMAISMGRTLVLPPKWSMWPYHDGGFTETSFDDFFQLDSLQENHPEIVIISMEKFLRSVASTGNLRRESAHDVVGVLPPEKKTSWEGDPNVAELWEYLRYVAIVPAWDFNQCVAAFPSSLNDEQGEGNKRLMDVIGRIIRQADGRPKPVPLHFQGKPTASDAPSVERLRETMGGREELCFYDSTMKNANLIHFPTFGNGEPSPFYASIFFEEWTHDLWAKRLIRDHLRYKDEIQCAAARVVEAVRARALEESSGKDVLFDAVHLRRGNFVQTYGDAVPSVDDITTVVEERIERGSTLYMSTDESQVGFQDLVSSLGSDYTTVTLHDYLGVLSGVNVNFFGPIDQIVASKSRTFVGTYYSAFTGYINRLRGYHSTVPEEDKRADGIVASYYFAPNAVRADMRVYKAIRRPFFAREWPVSWRQIDADISDEGG